ncbi:barstar family protein [Prosthecobacter sp.]|uniref:barstar family protein n=1 Tax=Prosthecobacter sp. TaxID=1965333 RepID=UPI0037847ECF
MIAFNSRHKSTQIVNVHPMEIHIEGKKISTEGELHTSLANLLDFGPYYGRNLAALRDRLLTDVERPITLIWDDSAISKRFMGSTLFGKITAIFNEAVKQDLDFKMDERFVYELR